MTNLARNLLLHTFLFAVCLLAFAGQAHAQGGMTLNSSYSCNAGFGCSGNVNIITDVAVRLNADNTATIGGCYVASYAGSIGGGFNGTYIVMEGNNTLFTSSFSNSSPPINGNLNFSQRTFAIPAGVNPLNLRMRVFFSHNINGSQGYQFDTLADGTLGGGGGGTCNSSGSCNYQWRRYTPGNFPGGCGGSGVGPDPVCQTITGFTASPSTINAGDSTTLSWTTANATSVDIVDLATGSTVASGLPANGSLVVSPPSSRSYRVVAYGSCAAVSADVAVTVNACQSIGSFSASATTINAGQSTTLSYSLTNASSATITDLTSGTVTSVPVQSGSLVVTPPDTRTYRLSAFGACGTVTQDIQINVNQPPSIITFWVNPNPICAGATTTLGWDTGGATAVSITDLATGAVTSGLGTSGTLNVTPPTSRTYRLTASNGAGSVTQDVAVTVNPLAAINSFSASASTINAGQSTNLNFNVSNTSSRSITDLTTGAVTNLGVESGAISVTPPTTRTFRLTASNGCNTVTQDVTVTVIQPPSISSFTANVGSVCAGGAATLSWSASGGTSATVSAPGLPGSPVAVNPAGGSLVVNPTSTTTYTLTVSNSAGSVTATVTVNVTPAPSISSFSASATTINAGQSTTLSFSSSNGASASITDLTSGVVTSVPVNGSLVVTPPTSRTYRFTVSGTCGTVTQDLAITVIQPPTISSFTASASPVCSGGASTLSWTASGGTSATISAPGLPGSPVSVNANSGSLVVNPTSTTTYTLTVTNSAGSVTRTVIVNVTPAPAISTYSASATTINVGQSTTLSWTSTNGTSASITDLSTSTVTSVPVNGSLVVTPPTTRAYRLTITGTCGTVTQDLTITVTQAPVISTFTASASPVCSGGASTLSWSASGGTSATISATGLPGSPVSVNPNSGTLVVNPTATTTYTLTVTNAAGSTTRTVTVTVTPAPTIGSYSASPTTVVQGSSSTLTWTSSNGTSASVTDLTSGTVTSVPVNGSLVVTPATTRAYRLTITGSCGTVTQDVTITVTPCQTISTFTASATTINAGQSTTLSYTLTGATSATITDLLAGTVTSVPVQSGSLVVSPATSRTYRLSAVGPCATVTSDLSITVNPLPGVPMLGPQGQPLAVGPTDSNDDYTNMTAINGVGVPFGGTTTAGGVITFTNTAFNNSSSAQSMAFSARIIPAGFTVDCSADGGATWTNLNTGMLTGTAPGGATYTLLVRVTFPAGLNVLTAYPITLRLANTTDASFNETIDRLWMGFVRADKSVSVANSTGVGTPTSAVSGAVITYTVNYSNVTPAASGTGNVNLTATNIILTENGNAAPNNWGTTTNHVPGSATDSRGGTITGDVAGSSLLTDTIPSLGPAQAGVFTFKRVIK